MSVGTTSAMRVGPPVSGNGPRVAVGIGVVRGLGRSSGRGGTKRQSVAGEEARWMYACTTPVSGYRAVKSVKTMTEHSYTVEVQPDFLERQSKARPVQAVAELVWNGLDADASRVDVRLEYGDLGMTRVIVRDNGHGIPYEDAPELFTRLGGSWKKAGGRTKTKQRMLHGYEGRGRFKVFALGRVADWRVTYRTDEGDLRAYVITILEDNIREVRITLEDSAPDGSHRGRDRSIGATSRLPLARGGACGAGACRNLCVVPEGLPGGFDPVRRYAGRSRSGDRNDADSAVERDRGLRHRLPCGTGNHRVAQRDHARALPVYGARLSAHEGDDAVSTSVSFHFSAYLKSSFVTRLHGEAQLDLAEMNPLLESCVEEAQQDVKAYFRDRAAERARNVVEEWKAENVYPYEGEAQSPLEDAERKVFDILAVTASDYMPDFVSAPSKRKAFDLRMLRTAIEKSPEELQVIMNEVLGLPKRKQEELAELLREASLSSIISAAKIVSDRLKFLAGLEKILFDSDMQARLKERSQLHKIIEDNTWLFGEEYNLSVSDRGLTNVLRKHRKILGDEVVIDRPVRHVSQERGIIDLMLSRTLRRHRADEVEHLVVELKRPNVKIGDDEITQVENYAISVARDERFRLVNGVTWTFWAISDDVSEYAAYRMNDRGVISSKDGLSVGIMTWGQIIEENKARLQFFQEKLEHQVDDETALKHLQEKYQRFLAGVVPESENEAEDEELPDAVGVDA